MDKRIYLTIDVECHDIRKRNQYIDGKTNNGNCGLQHILNIAKKMNIPVNCFFDIVEAYEYGEDYINEIISLIHSYNQHVYFHLHPDYITNNHDRSFLWQYNKEEKKVILKKGFSLYRRVLGHDVRFFRVGRYGADKEMYELLNELSFNITDLSYCTHCPKMCHIDSDTIETNNRAVRFENQCIMPNTRYLGLSLGERKYYFNLDASETTYNEFKHIIDKTQLNQMVFTMHSWNFIKKYFFLSNYLALNKSAEKKFKKMVEYAKSKGFEFSDLERNPPVEGIGIDEVLDLCHGLSGKISMVINNFVRFQNIGRLNLKYFLLYVAFYTLAILMLIIMALVLV